jgi:hypothetical protein
LQFHGPTALDRLDKGILANPLGAAEHDGVVDLLTRPLHPVGEPADNVVAIIRIDFIDVVEPRFGHGGVAGYDGRRSVEIEAGHPGALDPSAFIDQTAGNQHLQAGAPRHLLHRAVLGEPRAWLLVRRSCRHTGVDTAGRPHFACRNVNVRVRGHVGEKVFERDTAGWCIGSRRSLPHIEPPGQRPGGVLTPDFATPHETGNTLTVRLHIHGAGSRAGAVSPFVISGRSGNDLNHVSNVVSTPSGACEHTTDYERAFVVCSVAGIVPLEQTCDRKLGDGMLEFGSSDVRRRTVVYPGDRLAGFMHRRREYRSRAFAVGSDTKFDEHRAGSAGGEFGITNDGCLLGLVQIRDIELMAAGLRPAAEDCAGCRQEFERESDRVGAIEVDVGQSVADDTKLDRDILSVAVKLSRVKRPVLPTLADGPLGPARNRHRFPSAPIIIERDGRYGGVAVALCGHFMGSQSVAGRLMGGERAAYAAALALAPSVKRYFVVKVAVARRLSGNDRLRRHRPRQRWYRLDRRCDRHRHRHHRGQRFTVPQLPADQPEDRVINGGVVLGIEAAALDLHFRDKTAAVGFPVHANQFADLADRASPRLP